MVAPTYASPGIGNYHVGRGFLQMKLTGESGFSDMGNCTTFTFQVKPTLLEHFSTRVGVRTKDLVVVTELAATLEMSLDEITARNMAIAMLGEASVSGSVSIDMLSLPLFEAALHFTPTNVVGPQWTYDFPLVLITPRNAVSLISAGSGSWTTIDLQADVLKDPVTGQFGVATSDSFT